VDWKVDYQKKLRSAEEVARMINSGDTIGIGGGSCIPPAIVKAICDRADELSNVTFCGGDAVALHGYMNTKLKHIFRNETIFIGPAERLCIDLGICDFVPNHLGESGSWVAERGVNIGAFVVTPPDENGYFNRSLFGGMVPKAAIPSMKPLCVEVNRNTPWLTSDDLLLHISEVDYIVENDSPVFETFEIPITEVEQEIAGRIAEMIPDGSTIQLGLGGLANCVGHFLKHKHDLGIHSEVVTNSIMELYFDGVINNSKKTYLHGKAAYTFAAGDQKLFDFLDHNKDFIAFEIGTINDPDIIALNDNMVSVNNALMIDLTGQVASESIGTRQYAATGG